MIKKYRVNLDSVLKIEPNVSCIGFFDGVHIGHQKLINKTIELSKSLDVEPYLITFYPDPLDIITSKKTKHINSYNQRLKLFEKFGIKGVIIIDFDIKTMNMDKRDFVLDILSKLNLKALVCGFDFKYGYKGLGNYKTLKKDIKGICNLVVVDEVKYYGRKVSSTRIKEEIDKENYKLVNKLLGYEYK